MRKDIENQEENCTNCSICAALQQEWEQYKLEIKQASRKAFLDKAWEVEKAERERIERLRWEFELTTKGE